MTPSTFRTVHESWKAPDLKIQESLSDRCSPVSVSGWNLEALAQILQQLRGNYLKTVKLWDVDRASAITLTVIKGEEVLSVRVIRDQVGGGGGEQFFRDVQKPGMNQEAAGRRRACLSWRHRRQEGCESSKKGKEQLKIADEWLPVMHH